jgi:ferredoxin
MIGDSIANGMKEAGASAAAVRLEFLTMTPDRIAKADMLGIGSPVYFLREASYIADFISKLPRLDGKKAFVYCTSGMDRVGETLHRLQALLAERGAIVVGAQYFSTAMSYPPYRKRGLGNPEKMPDQTVLTAARNFGERMARARDLDPIPLPTVSLGTKLKAGVIGNRSFRNLAFPAIQVNHDTCTGYGSCISRCPFHGLEREDDAEIPFVTDACIQCLQCVDFCPKAAIASNNPVREWISTLSYRLGLH